MIGFAVALTSEAILPLDGLFGEYSGRSTLVLGLCLGGVVVIGLAAMAAYVSTLPGQSGAAAAGSGAGRRRKSRFLEPVLASLTSTFGSEGSVTDKNVDTALELTMENVFTPVFLKENFPFLSSESTSRR